MTNNTKPDKEEDEGEELHAPFPDMTSGGGRINKAATLGQVPDTQCGPP